MLQHSGIGQIALTVSNVADATAFYRDRVGLKFLFEVPGMSFFDAGGPRLLLGQAEPGSTAAPGSTILYFRVDDIEAAHRELSARDVPCLREPRLAHRAGDHDLWLAFYRDPDENRFALMSEVRSS